MSCKYVFQLKTMSTGCMQYHHPELLQSLRPLHSTGGYLPQSLHVLDYIINSRVLAMFFTASAVFL